MRTYLTNLEIFLKQQGTDEFYAILKDFCEVKALMAKYPSETFETMSASILNEANKRLNEKITKED
jgi:hypothetical protein